MTDEAAALTGAQLNVLDDARLWSIKATAFQAINAAAFAAMDVIRMHLDR